MWNVSLDASFPLSEKDCYVSTVYKTAWYYYMKIYLVWSYDDDLNFIPIPTTKNREIHRGEWTMNEDKLKTEGRHSYFR